MANPTLQESFTTKLKAALGSDGAMRDLNGFIKMSITDEAGLLACLWQYCIGFNADRAQLEENAKQRGLVIGYSLFNRAIELAGQLNNLAELVPRTLRAGRDAAAEPDHQYVIYAERWSRLPEQDRRRLQQLANQKRTDLRDRQTLLSPLVKAFVERRGKSPTLDDLYDFDPADNLLRKEFDAIAQSCAGVWKQLAKNIRPTEQSLKALDAVFQRFSAFLTKRATEPLVFFQVLKWIREASGFRPTRVEGGKKDFTTPPWSVIWQELYLDASFHAIRMAVGRWNMLTVQEARSLPPEDAAFFLSVHSNAREKAKLDSRLRSGFRDVAGFVEVNRVRRRQDRFAAHARLELLDEIETVELLNHIAVEMQQRPQSVSKLFVRVESVHDAFRDRYRVNQTVLDDFTIIWIAGEARETRVVVEFHNMDCVLFRTDQGGLGVLIKNAFYKALAKNAEALKVFLLAYLELLGLIADVATAGAVGGFRRFVFEFVKERLKEKLTDRALDAAGVDNAALRTAAGIGVNLVRPRGPKAEPGRTDQGLDLDQQRAAAIGDRTTLPSTAREPWTAAEQAALKEQGILDLGKARTKQADRVAAQREQQVVVRADEGEAVLAAGGGGRGRDPRRGQVRPTPASRDGQGGGIDVATRAVGSRSTKPVRREPARESVPEPHPYTDRPVKHLSPEYVRSFYTTHLDRYPDHIQQLIKKLPKAKSGRLPWVTELKAIDAAIMKEHTDLANRMAGYGRKADKPFVSSSRARYNAGNLFSSAVTDQKGLSLTGKLKGGGVVEFDSVGFRSSRLVETKMNLAFKNQQDVYDQMRRQARFAQDWGFSSVRWEVWDEASIPMARRALAELRHNEPRLGALLDVTNPAQAH